MFKYVIQWEYNIKGGDMDGVAKIKQRINRHT